MTTDSIEKSLWGEGKTVLKGFTAVSAGPGGADHVHVFMLGIDPKSGAMTGLTELQDRGEGHSHLIDLRAGESQVTAGASRGAEHTHTFALFESPLSNPQALNPVQLRELSKVMYALPAEMLSAAGFKGDPMEKAQDYADLADILEKATVSLLPKKGFFTLVRGEAIQAGDEQPARLGPPTPTDMDRYAVLGKDGSAVLGQFRSFSESSAIAEAQKFMAAKSQRLGHLARAVGRLDALPVFKYLVTIEVSE